MNTIILFSSRYGCAEDCGESLKAGLPGAVKLINMDRVNINAIDLEPYDSVILGSSIYIGSVSKNMKAFCKNNVDVLCRKKVGIYLCSAFSEQADQYASQNFPPALLKHASVIKGFGGEARLNKMKTIDKLIMRAATKGRYDSLKISHENITEFLQIFGQP